MKRRTAVAVSVALLLIFGLVPIVPAAAPAAATSTADRPSSSSAEPRSRRHRRLGQPKPSKIDFANAAVKAERAALKAVRDDFRRWLKANAPKARITSEMDIAVHAVGVELNGTTLATLRTAPMVRYAELQGIFRSVAHDDPDLSLIHANEAWAAVGGAANAGAGVKVAVIDSGIDATHPCFDDAGYAAQTQLGDTSLTNNKVIVAKVFNNNAKKFGFDASAVDSHGTHVAGTIACNAHTPAVINGVDIPYDPSGVAPRALLGNYNVFPGDTGSARSEDILNAMDEAYEDGFDVANMSLGGARNDGGGAFLLDNAIDNLDRANMVVAVAAGNEGPGYFTVHYPGAAPRALTAGASTVGHSIVNLVTVDGTDYEAVVGDFGSITSDVTGPLAVIPGASVYPHHLSLACDGPFEALPTGTDLTGKIALLGRGDCDFTIKVRNAQNAGAIGVIMVNRVPGEAPFVMSHNGLEAKPTIPAVMVSLEDGAVIDDHDGGSSTIHALGVYVTTARGHEPDGGLQQLGADPRRPADQARRRRSRRRHHQLVPAAPLRSAPARGLLELPRRHLDGHPASRRHRRRRAWRPPELDGRTGPFRRRQHGPARPASPSGDRRRHRRRPDRRGGVGRRRGRGRCRRRRSIRSARRSGMSRADRAAADRPRS